MAEPTAPAPQSTRARLLRFTSNFREKVVEVDVPNEDGTTEKLRVLVRQPSVQQRDRLLGEAVTEDGKLDRKGGISRRQVAAVMLCSLDPDTRQPLFTEADFDTLLQLPSGGWLDTLAAEAMELMAAGTTAATKSA